MTEIFADGVSAIAVSNGVARIELVQLRKAQVGEARLVPEPTATLFLPIAGLQQLLNQLGQTARRLKDQESARAQGAAAARDESAAEEALTKL